MKTRGKLFEDYVTHDEDTATFEVLLDIRDLLMQQNKLLEVETVEVDPTNFDDTLGNS